MIVIENLNPIIIILILLIIVFIVRFVIKQIRVSRITKNSLKYNENKKNQKKNNTKNEPYTNIQLEKSIDLLIKKLSEKSINESINEVIKHESSAIANEYKQIQNEIKLGVSISKSFERLYKKTHNNKIKVLCECLKLYDKQKMSLNDIYDYFNTIDQEEKKIKEKTKKLYINNNMAAKLLSVVSLSIVAIIFIVSIEDSPIIGLVKWIEFLIVVILTYLIYFEISDYYTSLNYRRIRRIKDEKKYIELANILYKKKIPINESVKLIESLENSALGKKIKAMCKSIWDNPNNEIKNIEMEYEKKIIKEYKKIPYKLVINWTICTTITIIAIVYLKK